MASSASILQRVDLAGPGLVRLVARRVAAAVLVVDRQRRLVLGVEPAPALQRRLQLGRRRLERKLALRRVAIEVHRVAGGMDDQHAALAGRHEHIVHPRRHLGHAGRRPRAPVLVPHVADDDGRLPRVPFQRLVDDADRRRILGVDRAGAGVQHERRRFGGRCGHGKDVQCEQATTGKPEAGVHGSSAWRWEWIGSRPV